MLGKWLSPMHPHYPSPELYLLLHSLSLGWGRGVLHQPQVSPAPPSASPEPDQALPGQLWPGSVTTSGRSSQHGSSQPSPASRYRHRMQQGLSTQGPTLWSLIMLEAEQVLLWTLATRSHQISPERASRVPWGRTWQVSG